ncbi:kinase domain protein (macronuclear) [Tetrahymena thermophila SB210]|uniref:Kinase domain protein n=1 Tax=Tetrahymena thermophila (strain SB210) TaxID=312017 RepID=Q24D99_TETTS|nr:kinase domain protein [Tetrahymena thermophila SB210]EAS05746.2 kinase domain protein [Tetrahymena thermophila SB210]|eukprot:XP_001025991.2 kinase domain protein [Tetrahymena thermophila SB210]
MQLNLKSIILTSIYFSKKFTNSSLQFHTNLKINIKCQNYSDDYIASTISSALQKCTNLTTLELNLKGQIGRKGLDNLCQALRECINLTNLTLDVELKEGYGVMEICSALSECSNISTLNLHFDLKSCYIGEVEIAFLSYALEKCPNLAQLSLSFGDVSNDDILQISNLALALSKHTNLQAFNLKIGQFHIICY